MNNKIKDQRNSLSLQKKLLNQVVNSYQLDGVLKIWSVIEVVTQLIDYLGKIHPLQIFMLLA